MNAPIVRVTEARIVFALMAGMFVAAMFSLYQWNDLVSALVIGGYVLVAQQLVENFFEHPVIDNARAWVVVAATLGYIELFLQAMALWNVNISVEVATGFALFCRRIVAGYCRQAELENPVGPMAPIGDIGSTALVLAAPVAVAAAPKPAVVPTKPVVPI